MVRLDACETVFAGRMASVGRGILIGTAAVLLMSCGGASTPTQPTTPTTPGSTILISGAMVLATGGTTQLVATITTGSSTTRLSNATWQSQSPQIATVSSTGLVTGISPGEAFISASASGVTGQAFVNVHQPSTGTSVLTACGTINAPGNYSLANDLVGSNSCLFISNVAGVHLDCGGHTSPGMYLNNVSGATITNCLVSANVQLATVTSVTITNCTFNNGLAIGESQSVIVSDTTLTSSAAPVTSTAGNDVELLHDVLINTGSGASDAGGLLFFKGSNNRVEQTTISSSYDGSAARVWGDDGIILDMEAGDTIRGNTISGFFDIGIESVDALANTMILNNTFSNIGNAAVGSYYCTDWTNNIVHGNQVSQTPMLVLVLYQQNSGICGTTATPAVFTNNQFIGNAFRNPIHTMENQSGRGPSMAVTMAGVGGTVSGNVLQNNDFASFDGPDLTPLDGFIDGGGNICGPLDPAYSNFACTGGSASTGGFARFRTPRR